MDPLEPYLSGEKLYRDDFGPAQIAQWVAEERDGYADLGARDHESYRYAYHALNRLHGYRHLRARPFEHVLRFGSAYGDEFLPIIQRVKSVTIVDPSDAFVRAEVHGTPAKYGKPRPDRRLPFPAATFDLGTCLGVLHHLPKVASVLRELARMLRPGGYLLLREPIVFMGDRRKPRGGLTKRERGIPLSLPVSMLDGSGRDIISKHRCALALTERVFRRWRADFYNSSVAARIDSVLSTLFAWNVNHHPRNPLRPLRPAAVFFVLRKRAPEPAAAEGVAELAERGSGAGSATAGDAGLPLGRFGVVCVQADRSESRPLLLTCAHALG